MKQISLAEFLYCIPCNTAEDRRKRLNWKIIKESGEVWVGKVLQDYVVPCLP